MIRRVIQIDEEKCNGCGACAKACHEGAIGMANGKAKLLRDDYCDGLGDCLPECAAGAIRFVKREAAPYSEEAVMENRKRAKQESEVREESTKNAGISGCPGQKAVKLQHKKEQQMAVSYEKPVSQLAQWPCQIKLAPINAPYFDGAKLLIAADCTAYAYANFHQEFMKGKVTLIGCPKLDGVDYSEKLTRMIAENDIQSVTVLRMEVPCCGGLELAAGKALQNSGKSIPWQVITISIHGEILDN